jgi:hypothetical protein
LAKKAATQQKEIDRLQGVVDRFGAKATKAAMAHSIEKRIARIEQTNSGDQKSSVWICGSVHARATKNNVPIAKDDKARMATPAVLNKEGPQSRATIGVWFQLNRRLPMHGQHQQGEQWPRTGRSAKSRCASRPLARSASG